MNNNWEDELHQLSDSESNLIASTAAGTAQEQAVFNADIAHNQAITENALEHPGFHVY